MGGNNERSGH